MAGGKLISTGVEFPDATTQTTSALPLTGGTMTGTIAGFTSTGIDDNATSTAITIDASENVGIGTTAPTNYYSGADNLVISQASGEGGISIVTANNTNGALYFADGVTSAQAYAGGITYSHTLDRLSLVSGGVARIRVEAAGDLKVETGNLVIGTSGKGIDFSADGNAAGMTSEVLDDYETGTYTPAWQNITVGNGTNTGTYVKVGNVVTVTANLILGSTSVVGSNVNVSLPFTNTGLGSAGSGRLRVGSITYPAWGELTAGQTVLWFKVLFSGSTILVPSTISATNPGTWTTGDAMHLTITYVTA